MVGRPRVAEKCFANGAKTAGSSRQASQYAKVGERAMSCSKNVSRKVSWGTRSARYMMISQQEFGRATPNGFPWDFPLSNGRR